MSQETTIKLEIDNQMILDSLKDSINKMVAEKVTNEVKRIIEEVEANKNPISEDKKHELSSAMLFDITRYAIANFCENPAEAVREASKMVLQKERPFENHPMLFLMFVHLSEKFQKEVSKPELIRKHA